MAAGLPDKGPTLEWLNREADYDRLLESGCSAGPLANAFTSPALSEEWISYILLCIEDVNQVFS
jgi:hypothetical protein